MRLLVRRGFAVWLRASVVQAVFATLLGGVVCVQWITGRMCACVVSVCMCVFFTKAWVCLRLRSWRVWTRSVQTQERTQ